MSPPTKTIEESTIAILLGSFSGGGSERAMINFANGLAAQGKRVDMLAGAHDGPFRSIVSDNVNVIDLGKGMMAALPKIRKYLRQHRPGILFASQLHVNIVAILSRIGNRVPTKIVIREATTPSESIKYQTSTKQKTLVSIARRLFRRADHLIAVSDDSREDCIKFYRLNSDRVSTIYAPFVNDELYRLAAKPIDHPWLESTIPLVVSMGRVMPVKDFLTLVKAFAKAKQTIDCRLMIIGETSRDPECYRRVKESIAQLGIESDVDFIGFKKNPFPYLAKSDTYVLSSKFEGMPGSLVQAMALGCKLVSTRCRSGPREVLAGGKRGQLVPVGDVDELARGIVTALKMPHDRSLGRQWASDFTEQNAIQTLVELFDRIQQS